MYGIMLFILTTKFARWTDEDTASAKRWKVVLGVVIIIALCSLELSEKKKKKS